MITARLYRKRFESVWNIFLRQSANGTFLLDRRFMEYHKDRFFDRSLLLFNKQHLVAIFPACVSRANPRTTVVSHEGLSYAGLIVAPYTSLLTALSCYRSITSYYKKNGVTTLIIRPVPDFFHTQTVGFDAYAMHILQANITCVTANFVADLTTPLHFSTRRRRQIQKAKKSGVQLVKAPNCRLFWSDVLIPRLISRYGAKPVHTISEIERLRKNFPNNIIQYNTLVSGRISAGVTLFIHRTIAHAQYIASNELGRATGSLDYLFWRLMTGLVPGITRVSFGTSNEPGIHGRKLNTGLARWKEEFGATMVPHKEYEVATKNVRLITQYTKQ